MLRPLAGSGEGDPSRAGVPGSALVYISQTKHMSLQEVEMTLEDTISLVLSLHQLLEVSVSAGFSHLLSSLGEWGGGDTAFRREEPTSVTVLFFLLRGVEFLILAGQPPFVVLSFEQSSKGRLPGDISRHFPALDLPDWGGALY